MEVDEHASGGHPAAVGDNEVSGAFALLAELSDEFSRSQDLDQTLWRALSRTVEQLRAEAGSLWLLDEAGATLQCRASVGPQAITGLQLPVTEGIVGRSVRTGEVQTVLDVAEDPAFSVQVDEKSGFTTRSLLCAPLGIDDRILGAIELVNKKGDGGCFSERDVHPLRVLAASAALALSNARMAASLVEAESTRKELELAGEIQRSFLPARGSEDFPLHGVNVPARVVSGDFFDFLELPDGRISFCLGDVSGKGMNASLLMAKSASLYHCLAKTTPSPGRLLGHLDREIIEKSTRGMFVTMAAGVLDRETGRVCLANAGHPPPLLQAEGGFEAFTAVAPPLGIVPGVVPGGVFPETEFSLRGGTLYLYSDGLSEAETGGGEMLGQGGLQDLITREGDRPLVQRVERIVEEVARLDLRDDLTVLAVSAGG